MLQSLEPASIAPSDWPGEVVNEIGLASLKGCKNSIRYSLADSIWIAMSTETLHLLQLDLLDAHLIVFVLPTTGNGAPPPTFVPLWTSLLHPQLPSDLLDHLQSVSLSMLSRSFFNQETIAYSVIGLHSYAVFALGDSSYGKYNWVGKKMSRRLDALGAHAVIERGEGDDQNELG